MNENGVRLNSSFYYVNKDKEAVRKIVSHKAPRHSDDFWALVLAANYYIPIEGYEFISPQEVPSEYVESDDIMLIDVGRDFDEGKLNFDHHQDKNILCSFMLLLSYLAKKYPGKNELVSILISDVATQIDYLDRKGYQNLVKEFNLTENTKEFLLGGKFYTLKPQEIINIVLDLNITIPYVYKTLYSAMCYSIIDKQSSNINEFYQNILQYLIDNTTIDLEEMLIEQRQELQKELEHVRIFEYSGFKIAYSPDEVIKNTRTLFETGGVDLIVSKNSQNPRHTSITLENKYVRMYDLRKLKEYYDIVFIHNSGHFCAINEETTKVDPLVIAKIIFD